ncbi:hypothetical protein [Lentzea sp.]|uniref:hypothetical protein n=1 Tax=Lentzea sp. TaxID=56099 RepID=UPI002ED4724C
MTENRRDMDPPRRGKTGNTPWELVLGHTLEHAYSTFTELPLAFADGVADRLFQEFAVVRRWMRSHLIRAGVPELLVAAADHAMANLRQFVRPAAYLEQELIRRRGAIRSTFELLELTTRGHVRPERRRYFDLGIALSRVNICVILHHFTPELPAEVHQNWPGLDDIYRRELWRSCSMLVSFVREDDGDSRPDPALRDLDDAFRAFADHLAPLAATEGPFDQEALNLLHAKSTAAGLSRSAKTAKEYTDD